MGDEFTGLPDWVNYIIKFNGSTVYVETIEQGVSGRVSVEGGTIGNYRTLSNPGQTGEYHQWYKPDGGPKKTLAVRERPTEPVGRTLTEEEVGVLQDLGLLDYALTQAGHMTPEADQDTDLTVCVWDRVNEGMVYCHDETSGKPKVTNVHGFAEVMVEAFKALGFENRMIIEFPDVTGCPRFSTDESDSEI